MTDKELRKLRREDLLQILLVQQKQLDEQGAALERSEKALADRRIAIEEAGSLAEAALRLNGVFEAAQAAADTYLEEARRRAEALAAEAEGKAEAARREAEALVRDARSEAERILRSARGEAEALKAQVQAAVPPQTAPEAETGDADDDSGRRGWFRRGRKP